ncbi:acyltransferase [Altererythrobacter sp. TH136]|uniref:acyltransferase family protein n=1 Tax=Altererythrobacter sp. TH136 TaxID=2067415 RepID=UPI0011646CD2|nr:acyltransferase [Altererythrobacter sp. TH136]QDM40362.1 acyltransferase [Altererythrobacter sp. TH136]
MAELNNSAAGLEVAASQATVSASGSPSSELSSLTAARGIAAWWVVVFHLHFYLPPAPFGALSLVLKSGNLAVDFFFVLSGFVIQLSWGRRIGEEEGPMKFFVARFARIYPLHLLLLLAFAVYFSAAVIFGSSTSAADPQPLYFLMSLFLVQNWGFAAETSWNVPAWSISAEAGAYLLFPLLLAMLSPGRRPIWLLLLCILFLSLALHGWFRLFDYSFPNDVAQTGLARCIVQFAIGMIVCEVYERLSPSRREGHLLLIISGCLAACWFAFAAPVVPLAWATLILGLACGGAQWLSFAPLVWIGRISFATYLSHYFVLMVYKFVFLDEGGTLRLPVSILYAATVLVLSALLYHCFERPAQQTVLDRFGTPNSRGMKRKASA